MRWKIAKQSMWIRTALATLLITGSCSICCAQAKAASGGKSQNAQSAPTTTPTQVQIDNAESTSKPDDVQIPEANPARPTITNPAHIPPVGYLQFEQGILQAIASPSGLDRQFSVVQTIRLSVHPRLMVEFQSQPFAVSRSAATATDPASSQTDPGDLILGVQGLLVKEVARRPTIALSYLQRVRAGSSADLDIGSYSKSAVVLISGDLGGFRYDSNYIISEQLAAPVRRAQFAQTLSVTHDLFPERFHDKLGITGEIWHFSQPLVDTTRDGRASPRSNAVGTLWALGYTLRPNLVLDGGLERGLTSTSTAWQVVAGFTYLLPHRLWGRTEAGVAARRPDRVHYR